MATFYEKQDGTLMFGGRPVQNVAVSVATSGNNTAVAAVTGRKIRVLAWSFVADGAVTWKFQSGAGGTDLTGAFSLAANGIHPGAFNPMGWCETAAGALLNIVLGGAVGLRGSLTYVEV